jgi:phage FluMu gp28-like protein
MSPALPAKSTPTPGSVLLPYQQHWVDDKSPLKVSEKSRRTGLTWAEAADDALIAASAKSAGGMNVYYIGYNQDMAIEYIDACASWARVFNYAAGQIEEGWWEEGEDDKHIKTYTIRFPDSGFRIVALSSRPANLRGKQGVVVIDEAAFHDQLDELLKAALALLIWGGRVRIISTHNGEGNPFNDLVKEIRSSKRRGSVQRITFREAVAQGLYRRVCLRLGKAWTAQDEAEWMDGVYDFYGDAASEELDVIPKAGTGAYLPRILIEQCQRPSIPVLRYAKPAEWVTDPHRVDQAQLWITDVLKPIVDNLAGKRHAVGQDFGRDGDLSAYWVLQDQGAGHWHTAFVLELRRIPFDVQQLFLFYLLDTLPLLHKAKLDARGNGQAHAEAAVQRYGATLVEAVMLTAQWYGVHFPPYKAALEDQTITIPQSEDIIADHRRVILKKGVPGMDDGRDKGSDGQMRHGDTAVAGVLAYSAARDDGLVIGDFEAIKTSIWDEDFAWNG